MANDYPLSEKLFRIQKSVLQLQKEHKDGVRYSVNSSDQVVSAIRTEMDKWGVMLLPKVINTEVTNTVSGKNKNGNEIYHYTVTQKIVMSWRNRDDYTDKLDVPWFAIADDQNASFAFGQAQTYSEKMFLLKFFHIATNDTDPDIFQQELLKKVPATEAQLAALENQIDEVYTITSKKTPKEDWRTQLKIVSGINPNKQISDFTGYDFGKAAVLLNKWIEAYKKKQQKQTNVAEAAND